MSLFKRGNVWWVDFPLPSGARVRRSTGTSDKKDAQELHDKWKHEGWRVAKLGERPQHSWAEAAKRWLDEAELNGKRTIREDERIIGAMHELFKGKMLDDIDEDCVRRVVEEKRKDSNRYGKPVANATINRHLAVLRALLRKAMLEWKWLDKVPTIKLLAEPQGRVVMVEPERIKVLLDQLPEHLRDMAIFSLSTGLRQANVKGLQWSWVDLDRKLVSVPAAKSKSGSAIGVPLNQSALEVVTKQIGKHEDYVFTYKGKPIRNVNTRAYQNALERAGLSGLRWHDLRHCWASWLMQNGTHTRLLQELGGWASDRMVKRYAHLGVDHLRSSAAALDGVLGAVVSRGTA